MDRRDRWLRSGLFLTTLATLLLELLDARLLSVLTWYHLSFFAITVAMLGTAAGAVTVFLLGARVAGPNAARALARSTLVFSLLIPLTQFTLLKLQIPDTVSMGIEQALPLAIATVMLTVPFFLSGFAVTIALTRCGGRIGTLYGADLLGAAAGCLLIVPVLQVADIMTAALLAAAIAAAAAACFTRFAASGPGWAGTGAAVALAAASLVHLHLGSPIDVAYSKGLSLAKHSVDVSIWNAYSHVAIRKPEMGPPFYWGRGRTLEKAVANTAMMVIDGQAGTALTEWDGDPASIAWVRHDVTALPYHLRSGGAVGIIGVGGGRDILSAIWGNASSITAVEINRAFIDVLTDSHRDFANLAGVDELHLVNDEARSYFSRSTDRFDVLQMSLVDTWASTGAGAYTLTENALYTMEAWNLFLDRVNPTGLFSTSRWFSPTNVSETSRLLALAVSVLIDRGAESPARHIAMLARGPVATLLVSPSPLRETDLHELRQVAQAYAYLPLAFPGRAPADDRLARILASTSASELADAVADPIYDYRPPTDQRPYFFNMLKPASVFHLDELPLKDAGGFRVGVAWGNMRATLTLGMLLAVTGVLVIAILFVPLAWSGIPAMRSSGFALSLGYFALIGYGFMAVQIPFLQRFSVFLGHPVYTYSVILFAMIFFASLGSLASERLELTGNRWPMGIPCAIAGMLLSLAIGLDAVLDATLVLGLPGRIAVVLALVSPVSLLLGTCFPIGMRLVTRISSEATPWMWGANGACGVLASISGVAVSIWLGIHANLFLAATLYLALAVVAMPLVRVSSTADG